MKNLCPFIFICIFNIGFAQESDTLKANTEQNSIGLGSGLTLFSGDIAKTNYVNIVGYITYNRRITTYLSHSTSIFRGAFEGKKHKWENGDTANMGFKNDFWQIERTYKLYPLILFSNNKESTQRIQPYVFGGLGLINYKSYTYDLTTSKKINTVGYSNVGFKRSTYRTNFEVPIGIGCDFIFNDKLTGFTNISYSITNTDWLDAYVGKTKKDDGYAFINFGLNVNLDPIFEEQPRHTVTTLFGTNLLDDLHFALNSGYLMLWGEGGPYNGNIFAKFDNYANRTKGVGFNVEKIFRDKVYLRLSTIYGKLTGIGDYIDKNKGFTEFYFKTGFANVNLSQKIYLTKRTHRLTSVFATYGLGFIIYRSKAYNLQNDRILAYQGYTRNAGKLQKDAPKTNPTFPLSLGVEYRLKYNFSLVAEQMAVYAHTDRIDAVNNIASNKNDWFTYTCFGLRYSFPPEDKSFYAR